MQGSNILSFGETSTFVATDWGTEWSVGNDWQWLTDDRRKGQKIGCISDFSMQHTKNTEQSLRAK